ncbi:hypothetical protein [Nocardiopsis flavescens]|nr:hypothetical protein [Nocardiopsis flavescens]
MLETALAHPHFLALAALAALTGALWAISRRFERDSQTLNERLLAERDRATRRAISEQKAAQLAWAEAEGDKNPESRLARGILEVNRRNL